MGARRNHDDRSPNCCRSRHGSSQKSLGGAAKTLEYAAGQAAAVAHVAAHELGAAAYAIKAARAAVVESERDKAGRLEYQWQREQLPDAIGDLVLDDQRLRNEILLVGVRLLTGVTA